MRPILIICILAAVSLSVVIYFRQVINHLPPTTIKQSGAVIKSTNFGAPAEVTFNEPLFTIQLPSNWQPLKTSPSVTDRYDWTIKDQIGNQQSFSVYIDNIPPNFAVNRTVEVEPNHNQLTIMGQVSDNCLDFTKNVAVPGQIAVAAKWQGTDFLCDTEDQQAGVVGISSKSGINTVTLTDGTKQHDFFFSYTNNQSNPDYNTFYLALNSFRLK